MDPKEELRRLHTKWVDSGKQSQQGFAWRKSSGCWQMKIPHLASFIDSLPAEIDRGFVRDICNGSNSTYEQKLLTVMIWGYGDVGYGPYRVSRMFEMPLSTPLFKKVESLSKDNNVIEAYSLLQKNRIPQLGPSFASKLIYFLAPENPGSPVLDSVIGSWLSKNKVFNFEPRRYRIETWDVDFYASYLEWAREHARLLGISAGEIEQLIYESGYVV